MSTIDTPTGLSDLVEYQDASVVSQTLVKSKAGTVTAFAFDKGEGLSEHTAPFDALLQIIDGRAAITVGGKEHTVTSGEIIRLPANIPHAVTATDRFKMLLIMIREPKE